MHPTKSCLLTYDPLSSPAHTIITPFPLHSQKFTNKCSCLAMVNKQITYIGFPEILSRAVFWSIVVKDQRLFTFFVHSFNHIRGILNKSTTVLCHSIYRFVWKPLIACTHVLHVCRMVPSLFRACVCMFLNCYHSHLKKNVSKTQFTIY